MALPCVIAGCAGDDAMPADTGADAGSGDGSTSAAQTSTSGTSTAGSDTGSDTGAGVDMQGALALLQRLPGLWVAPVSSWTSAGDFLTMNMDIRPASDTVLFSRVDLDDANALRFAFSFETHDDATVLVFRNGGLFSGLERDTRTKLVEHDPDEETWRFCAISGGCAYVDATFDFDGPDAFDFDVDVMGMMHVHWSPTRPETRDAGDFPGELAPNPPDAPFPEMPTLHVQLSWSDPLAEPTDAWVILTTTDCGFTPGSCTPSRFMKVAVEVGATQAELDLVQIHPGTYRANAVLDRNGNLGGTLFPDPGDTVSLPNQSIEIDTQGQTDAQLALTVDL